MDKNERLIDEIKDQEINNENNSKAKNFSFSKESPIFNNRYESPNIKVKLNLNEININDKELSNISKRKAVKTINLKKIEIESDQNSINDKNSNLFSLQREKSDKINKINEIKFNNVYFTNDNIHDLEIDPKEISPKKTLRNKSFKSNGLVLDKSTISDNKNNGNILSYRNRRLPNENGNNVNTLSLIDKTKILIKETIALNHNKPNEKEENENNEKILSYVRDFRQYSIEQDMLDEQTTFYFSQFFEMVLLHLGFFLFGPFFCLFIACKYGKNLVRNLIFWGDKLFPTLLLQYSFWISTMITLTLSYFIFKKSEVKEENEFTNQYIFLSIAYMAQILIIIRYLIVCVKYGFFPKEYFKLFKVNDLMQHMIKSNFLSDGWIQPRFKIIDELINESLQKNKIDLVIFNLQCIGIIDSKLIHEIKIIELEISEDQEKLKNEYLMYLLKRVQLKKYKKILKNSKFEDSLRNIRKITTDEIDIEKRESAISSKINNGISEISQDRRILGKIKSFHKRDTEDNIPNKESQSNLTLSNPESPILNDSQIKFGDCSRKSSEENPNSDDSNTLGVKNEIKEYEANESETEYKPYCRRLRNIVINKVFPLIYANRKKNFEKINSLNGKLKNISENVFEINGLYLCRLMMKKAHDIKYESYFFLHVLLFVILLIIPNMFLGKIYLLNRDIKIAKCNKTQNNVSLTPNPICNNLVQQTIKFHLNQSNDNKTNINNSNISTDFSYNGTMFNYGNSSDSGKNQNTTNEINSNCTFKNINFTENVISWSSDMKNIKWTKISIIIWIFSILTYIIPSWLITKNLIYGLVDFQRRKRLLSIINEIINVSNSSDREFPLINISHFETLINWYTLRNIFMNYGKRFTDRIIIQVTIFCLLVLISLIIIIFIFLGYIQAVSFMLIGLCFVAHIFIDFILIFYMIKIGADYNYFENSVIDLLYTNKLLMDKIYLGIKKDILREEYSRNMINHKSENKKSSTKISENEMNYKQIFTNIIKKEDDISNDLGDLKEYHSKIIYVHNNIVEKIRMDHLIRPLRIFWIKSDYFLLTKILTIISGGVFMFLSYAIGDTLSKSFS